MNYLFFSVVGLALFVWNPLDIDPFTNSVNEEVFSYFAPKEVVRPIALAGHVELVMQGILGMDCLTKNYDTIYVIEEMPVKHSSQWNQKLHSHIQNTQLIYAASKAVSGV